MTEKPNIKQAVKRKVRRKTKTRSVANKKKRTGENVYIGKYEHVFNHKWTQNEITALADEIFEFAEKNKDKVFLNSFLAKKGIHRQRLTEFKENKYFDFIYSLVKEFFEERLFDKETTMAIFALKNNYNWRDKTEFEGSISSDITSKLSDEQVETLITKFSEYSKKRGKQDGE